MSEINLLFDFADRDAAERATPSIKQQLGQIEVIDRVVRARPLRMRVSGLEIAAAVAVTATVIQSGTNAVENMGKLVEAIRSLMLKLRDLKNVYVDIGDQRVPIDQLDTVKLTELAKGARGS